MTGWRIFSRIHGIYLKNLPGSQVTAGLEIQKDPAKNSHSLSFLGGVLDDSWFFFPTFYYDLGYTWVNTQRWPGTHGKDICRRLKRSPGLGYDCSQWSWGVRSDTGCQLVLRGQAVAQLTITGTVVQAEPDVAWLAPLARQMSRWWTASLGPNASEARSETWLRRRFGAQTRDCSTTESTDHILGVMAQIPTSVSLCQQMSGKLVCHVGSFFFGAGLHLSHLVGCSKCPTILSGTCYQNYPPWN